MQLQGVFTATCLAGALGAAAGAARFSPQNYSAEIDHLYAIGPRLTGSASHVAFMDRLERQLCGLGVHVHVDTLDFDYQKPAAHPDLSINGTSVGLSALYPYSGSVGSVTAPRVLLHGNSPDWSKAKDSIAVLSVPNPIFPASSVLGVWPGSEAWGSLSNPVVAADEAATSLVQAHAAGVKGVVYAWEDDITVANAEKQYLVFTNPYANVPAVWTSGAESKKVVDAADGAEITLCLEQPLAKGATRNLWVEIPGTTHANETVLILTHTDGTNAVEENGHLAVIQMLQDAIDHPPRRTHVFVFLGAHLRIPAVTSVKDGCTMTRWLADHPNYAQSAVAGLAVEHLGALEFAEDPEKNTYYPTGELQQEILYSNTDALAQLLYKEWKGANNATRVSQPIDTMQFGEGSALTKSDIPNISLVTSPIYLLKEMWGREVELIDLQVLERQVESFRTLQRIFDGLEVKDFR